MNRNSALIWLPVIEAAGLPTPKTIMIPYRHRDCTPIFDGEGSVEFSRIVAVVQAAACEIGYPAFIRTDLGSAKHTGPKAYKLERCESAAPLLGILLEDQEIKFWMEPYGPAAILVREFLTLQSPFNAFGGLPVNREFRFFSDGEQVYCWHPYWPADSIAGYVSEGMYPKWRESLAALHETPAEISVLMEMAITAAAAINRTSESKGRWSVDFCQDSAGKWWLIDCAVMQDSFHWPGCPNGRKS